MVFFWSILVLVSILVVLCFAAMLYYKPSILSHIDRFEIYKLYALDKDKKFTYKRLKKSNVNECISFMYNIKHLAMTFEKPIFAHKDFLLALSQFVDFKLNSGKQTFRAKENKILIEQISDLLTYELFTSGECNMFYKFKLLAKCFKLRQKEYKVFKLLLSQKLLMLLAMIETELIEISNVIKNAKRTTKICKFDKKLLFDAQIYSIFKYNPNSSKLLYNQNLDVGKIVSNLLYELLSSQQKLNVIIGYLIVMFN